MSSGHQIGLPSQTGKEKENAHATEEIGTAVRDVTNKPVALRVVSHRYNRGYILFRVEWDGKDPTDEVPQFLRTNAPHVLDAYFGAMGHMAAWKVYNPKGIFVFPQGTWEDDVERCHLWRNRETKEYRVDVYWKTGQVTEHSLETVYVKCPQAMLACYEKMIHFSQPSAT